MKTITVVTKDPGKDPEVRELQLTGHNEDYLIYQKLVGGDSFEPIRLDDDMILLLPENGSLNQLQPNLKAPSHIMTAHGYFVGTVAIVAEVDDDFAGLSHIQVEAAIKWLKENSV